MCMEQDNGYDFLPTMNPYCCRMFKRKDEKVVAFEDFCASSHDFARWLEPCEMDMTDIQCGALAEATYYHVNYQTRIQGSVKVYPGQTSERPNDTLPYFLQIDPVQDNDKEI